MPANRSRTERWRDCLEQVYERGGCLEISLEGSTSADGSDQPADLVWRVRILRLTDSEIVVEQPNALGQIMRIETDANVIAVLAIGQNRWMFPTRVIGTLDVSQPEGRGVSALRLEMPESVERCQRRQFYRMSTAQLRLPEVTCWPLLDPGSAVPAEIANRAVITDLLRGERPAPPLREEPLVMPEVGPSFRASLVNIGGGGAGLLVPPTESTAAARSRVLWVRVNLTPEIPAALAMTAKIAHTHLDSAQNQYLGIAFDFAAHPAHREFVVGQISRYVRAQLDRQNGTTRTQAA
jgi:hypothetical protein